MKLKYYLRGLGIGIIVTAVIMGVSKDNSPVEMTDAQIVERAKELGMIDGVLSQLEDEKTPGQEKPAEVEKASEAEKLAEAEKVPETEKSAEAEKQQPQEKPLEAEKEQETEKQPEMEKQPKLEKKPEAEKEPEAEIVKKVVVTVYPGEGSYTVSRKLAELGLVESADIYDKFLCQNGYDKKICTGNHEVEIGMTADEIARALTTR